MSDLEIMLGDLTEEVQQKVLEFYGLADAEDGNLDTTPLFILDNE